MDLTTALSSYKTFHTIADINSATDSDLTAAAGLGIGKSTNAIDLQILDGAGKHLKVNNFSIIVHTTEGTTDDLLTEKIYGAAEQGPPQLIASIIWKIGLARTDGSTSTLLWAQAATVTSTHMKTITVADGGENDRVCSVTFDLTGYRYVLGLWTAESGSSPHLVTALYRSF